jgi:hypothetical protein
MDFLSDKFIISAFFWTKRSHCEALQKECLAVRFLGLCSRIESTPACILYTSLYFLTAEKGKKI